MDIGPAAPSPLMPYPHHLRTKPHHGPGLAGGQQPGYAVLGFGGSPRHQGEDAGLALFEALVQIAAPAANVRTAEMIRAS